MGTVSDRSPDDRTAEASPLAAHKFHPLSRSRRGRDRPPAVPPFKVVLAQASSSRRHVRLSIGWNLSKAVYTICSTLRGDLRSRSLSRAIVAPMRSASSQFHESWSCWKSASLLSKYTYGALFEMPAFAAMSSTVVRW